VAHQGNVTGVVEDLMDIGHVAAQERTLGSAVHVSDKIQGDGSQQNSGQPPGSPSVCYGLLKHLNHVILLRIPAISVSDFFDLPAGGTTRHTGYTKFSTGIIADWAMPPNNLWIQF